VLGCFKEATSVVWFDFRCDNGWFHLCFFDAVDDGMIEKKVKVMNKLGLHARPAALIVKTAEQFISDIFFIKDGRQVNGKSIMGVMMLAAGCGSEILIRAKGRDNKEALEALEALILSKFGEE
jgi:phosphocarrier protein